MPPKHYSCPLLRRTLCALAPHTYTYIRTQAAHTVTNAYCATRTTSSWVNITHSMYATVSQVEPVAALHDLDNLRLADVAGGVARAEFELEALMLTGSCIEGGGRGAVATRGVQLHLGTLAQPHLVDTLVMSNLAYFQLKAAPGLWLLSLAPGRTQQLYFIKSSSGASGLARDAPSSSASAAAETTTIDLSTSVVISSLTGKHMLLQLAKRPGMEREDVLGPAGGSGGDSGACARASERQCSVGGRRGGARAGVAPVMRVAGATTGWQPVAPASSNHRHFSALIASISNEPC